MSRPDIESILMTEDIVPLGGFEALPIDLLGSGEAADYPDVAILKELPDLKELVEESYLHIDIVGKTYLRDRAPFLDSRVQLDELKSYLSSLGFGKDQYQSYSLRKLGTNQLEEFVGPRTRNFFETLGVETFRQQHTMSSNGWKTKIHRDHANFKAHGFRGMIPLNAPVYLGYLGPQGENLIYHLKPGHLYFANIAKPHRGFAVEENRLATMFQMASDRLVMEPTTRVLEPLKDLSQIPVHLIPYEL
jgi:hypothetical protein